mgnify:FL=1
MSINEYLHNFQGDFHKVHQGVWNLFGDQKSQRKFLYREEVKKNHVDILVRSDIDVQVLPSFGTIQKKMDPLSAIPEYKYRIWTTVNPIVAKAREGKKNSAKVPLIRKEDIEDWFKSRMEKNGVTVEKIVSSPPQRRLSKTKNFPLSTVAIQAIVKVNDGELFKKILANGLGSARSYGCGLVLALPLGRSEDFEENLDNDDY